MKNYISPIIEIIVYKPAEVLTISTETVENKTTFFEDTWKERNFEG